jgi:hypothetical protein
MTTFIRTLALAAALAQAPLPATVPSAVTLQISVTRQGEGKLSVQPLSLDASTDGKVSQVRLGSEVPVTMNGQTTFQQVGTQIDTIVTPDPSGRYKVALTITIRSLSEEKPPAQIQGPIFHNFIVASTLLLKIGETTETLVTDIATNETWQANVTLAAKK